MLTTMYVSKILLKLNYLFQCSHIFIFFTLLLIFYLQANVIQIRKDNVRHIYIKLRKEKIWNYRLQCNQHSCSCKKLLSLKIGINVKRNLMNILASLCVTNQLPAYSSKILLTVMMDRISRKYINVVQNIVHKCPGHAK